MIRLYVLVIMITHIVTYHYAYDAYLVALGSQFYEGYIGKVFLAGCVKHECHA